MKWRKQETRREKHERIQAEKGAPARASEALASERECFTLWCEEAEKIIRDAPGSSLAQEKADQLLLAAQHKHDVRPDPTLPVGPENGWKTQDTYENCHRASQAGYHFVRGRFPGLYEVLQRFSKGEQSRIDPVVDYLEAAPRFYRSGYLAEECVGLVRRVELTAYHKASLLSAVLKAADSQDRFRFKSYCRLARAVDSSELRSKLQALLCSDDTAVQRRAQTLLHSLAEKDARR